MRQERNNFDLKEAERILREQIDAVEQKAMDEMIELMTENTSDMGVTIFMPHVIDVAVRKTAADARRLFLASRSRKVVQVTSDMLKTLEKKLDEPINDDIKNYLVGKEVLAMLWSVDPESIVEEELKKFVQQVSEPSKDQAGAMDEDENPLIETRVLDELIVYLDGSDDSEERLSGDEGRLSELEDILRLSVAESVEKKNSIKSERSTSVASKKSERSNSVASKADDRPKIVIPPVWTPDNKPCNCLIMFTLFRNVTQSLR